MSARETWPDEPAEDLGLLRFLTCGSVDDGKSTLIGRLLYDSKAILTDNLHAIERSSQQRGMTTVDLSLITDGLLAEREQGITIDVAYRYFTTGARKFIIADAPGHEQYTRNMVTAASTADLAILLVDARKGIQTQTRRHAHIAHLLNVPNLVLAINKMDLVDYSREVFESIREDFTAFARQLGHADVRCIPISALDGDMVVERGDNLGWYGGPTLVECLHSAPTAASAREKDFRFPVQWVCRPRTAEHCDFRGFMGRVESGSIRPGDEVEVLPSGQRTRIRDILSLEEPLPAAQHEQSVTLRLEDEIDISRGDMIIHPPGSIRACKALHATICWLADAPLSPGRKLLVRHTTRETRAIVGDIESRLDIQTLQSGSANQLGLNDIGRIALKLAQPLFVDGYAHNRATGAFILIDESTNNTVGAGMID